MESFVVELEVGKLYRWDHASQGARVVHLPGAPFLRRKDFRDINTCIVFFGGGGEAMNYSII